MMTWDMERRFSLLAEGGKLLYDIDFDDLLNRYVKDIGLIEGRTLTVVDEEDDRVNVEFIISEGETLYPSGNRDNSKETSC